MSFAEAATGFVDMYRDFTQPGKIDALRFEIKALLHGGIKEEISHEHDARTDKLDLGTEMSKGC